MTSELHAVYISYIDFIRHLAFILKMVSRLSEYKKSMLITSGFIDFVDNRIIFLNVNHIFWIFSIFVYNFRNIIIDCRICLSSVYCCFQCSPETTISEQRSLSGFAFLLLALLIQEQVFVCLFCLIELNDCHQLKALFSTQNWFSDDDRIGISPVD